MRRLTAAAALACVLMAGCKRQGRPLALPPDEQAPLVSALAMSDQVHNVQLLRGFYELQETWRWTGKQFAVALRVPEGAAQSGAILDFEYAVPDVVLQKLGIVTLHVVAGGVPLPAAKIESSGQKFYRQPVPAAAIAGDAVTVEFSLDKALPPEGVETRELGLIAKSVSLERPPASK